MTSDPTKPPFRKILVANRGEIAVRIIRAIHEVGATAVSVYSDPDEAALHVQMSDETYRIGPGPAAKSYLNIEAILEAARESEAEAIHPGYGFLSENADFVQAVIDADLVFIGPLPGIIRLMGDKIASKRLMEESGIPVVPGYDGEALDEKTLRLEAERIGYPIMLKAAAGGGGRGMRVVEGPDQLADAIEGAKREAMAAFGDDRVFLEKLLVAPRHIEVQVLGDSQDNLIHLFERDCSVQRRHQKVIEEAPSPALNDEQRAALCETAIRAARAAGYVNAGTVEFLWSEGNFYFLEMNTRIQVEHPVTEMVTGRDLVIAQIEIAAGKPLEWKQEDIKLTGHAIEARLYAEDAEHGFLPQFADLVYFEYEGFEGIRVDTGARAEGEISRFYDPLIAKFIAHGLSRDEALGRLQSALYWGVDVAGVQTNRDFLGWVVESEQFRSGTATTALVDSWLEQQKLTGRKPDELILARAGADLTLSPRAMLYEDEAPKRPSSQPWYSHGGWRMGGVVQFSYLTGDQEYRVEAQRVPGPFWNITINGEHRYQGVRFALIEYKWLEVRIGAKIKTYRVLLGTGVHDIRVESDKDPTIAATFTSGSITERVLGRGAPAGRVDGASGRIAAPMPGTIVKISVGEGDGVQAHQPLVVLEAMKMEHVLEAPHAGKVKAIQRAEGELVAAGDLLVEIAGECMQ